jgi:diketogulonate reductase-like aldo/keto reductase
MSSSSSSKRAKLMPSSSFRATSATEARHLTDGALLSSIHENVVMPWVGFGTYKLGKKHAYQATFDALNSGYRCIDTAFIYASETTERNVGTALQTFLEERQDSLSREDVFIITKHWRKYHGYDATTKCLNTSLKRLQLEYIDLYLMHWPGPAWTTMNRKKSEMETHGKWHYAAHKQQDMVSIRAETWRAMEDALRKGKVRAIGVSNFTVQHLETLKTTATIWPPAVNQVECHPLYPQDELIEYCHKEGIVFQAYAAIGGQDASNVQWTELLGGNTLMTCPVVQEIATSVHKTPAQVLLRFALQRQCAVTPKTVSPERMLENSQVFDFTLSRAQMEALHDLEAPEERGRLCWKSDPLRMLDFE